MDYPLADSKFYYTVAIRIVDECDTVARIGGVLARLQSEIETMYYRREKFVRPEKPRFANVDIAIITTQQKIERIIALLNATETVEHAVIKTCDRGQLENGYVWHLRERDTKAAPA